MWQENEGSFFISHSKRGTIVQKEERHKPLEVVQRSSLRKNQIPLLFQKLFCHLFVSYWYSCTTKAKWQEENFDDYGLCGM